MTSAKPAIELKNYPSPDTKSFFINSLPAHAVVCFAYLIINCGQTRFMFS